MGQLPREASVQEVLQGALGDRHERRPGGAAAAGLCRHHGRAGRCDPRPALRPLQPGDEEARPVGRGLRLELRGRDRYRLPRGGARDPAREELRAPVAALDPRPDGRNRQQPGLLRHVLRPHFGQHGHVHGWRGHVFRGRPVPARHPAGRVRRDRPRQAPRRQPGPDPADGARRDGPGSQRRRADLRRRGGFLAADPALLPDAGGSAGRPGLAGELPLTSVWDPTPRDPRGRRVPAPRSTSVRRAAPSVRPGGRRVVPGSRLPGRGAAEVPCSTVGR